MTEKLEYNDYPIIDCVKQAQEIIDKNLEKNIETFIFQKWTCKHCNAHQTMTEPNTFYKSGKCEECNNITEIEECNYLVAMHLSRSISIHPYGRTEKHREKERKE